MSEILLNFIPIRFERTRP